MENANSKEYLQKITNQVIENLKKTAFVPSVQMTDVPRTTILGGTDEEDDIADDMDEDENKDVRMTSHRMDNQITRDDEFDESDDEDAAAKAYGNSKQDKPKRRNIMDYQNANAASDVEMDGNGVLTPNPVEDVDAMVTDTNAEVNQEIMAKKSADSVIAEAGEAGPSNAPSKAHSARATSAKPIIDIDGDVDMAEAEPAAQAKTPPNSSPAASATEPAVVTSEAAPKESPVKQEDTGSPKSSEKS